MNIIEVKGLTKYFTLSTGLLRREKKFVHAVDNVDFDIRPMETLGLAGESGSGKTTVARLLLRLIEPTNGITRFMGRNIFDLDKEDMRDLRREMQMIFQDPFASLNPRKTVRQILGHPYLLHKICSREEIEGRVIELLESVGLSPAQQFLDRYPHEFSGGQRQRIGIARAIALHPKFIAMDEPVSSLDISIRAQILNLLKDIKKKFQVTYLFITHDLSVLRSICDRVAIMYLGKIVEIAEVKDLYETPAHPYTQALLSAVPVPNPVTTRAKKHIILEGEPPSPINIPPGCPFHQRCRYMDPKCSKIAPKLVKVGKNHLVACHKTD
jgi:oligopeptide transport system ATP-binding protein